MFLEEEEENNHMTLNKILSICKKRNLYTFPELNEELFLNFGGFDNISSLEQFINLKSLWLNNNSIHIMENLNTLSNLVCLYLNYNVIEEISGLDKLENLEILVLSHNYIKKISGLENCKKLHTIEIDHNKISDLDDYIHLKNVPSLHVINIGGNKIESEDFLSVISELPNLSVFKLEGNPISRNMVNYRRKIIFNCPNLLNLDTQPIDELERKCSIIYLTQGKEAALLERQRILNEREEIKEKNRKEFKRINKENAIKAGIDIKNNPFFLSDNENIEEEINEEKDLLNID